MITYTITGSPITKKNSQQILRNRSTGRPFIVPSSAYRRWEAMAVGHLAPKPKGGPIECPVCVCCRFYMPTRRVVDLPNLQEAALDMLVKGGVLKDDNSRIVTTMDGSRVLYDKENPRTEIEITNLEATQ